ILVLLHFYLGHCLFSEVDFLFCVCCVLRVSIEPRVNEDLCCGQSLARVLSEQAA
ncbi:hypothetical protein M9458_037938, partial [Cirrhinus mrigala]